MPKEQLAAALHNVFKDATESVRERFGAADIGRFSLNITAEGRTMTDTDEVKIEYHISAGWDCNVKGNNLETCIIEVLRRHGWNERNAPLALAAPARPVRKPLKAV